jgi:DNA-binding transcriptional regulator YiaG
MQKSHMKNKSNGNKVLTTDNSDLIERYEAASLGAPFKVILHNAVREHLDEKTNKLSRTSIPNLGGLRKAVALARCMHSRKLSGAEIKFVRKSVGCKGIDLAGWLDITPEHLSRCEAGDRLLSGAAEKLLRVIVLKRTYMLVDVMEALILRVEQTGKHVDNLAELKDAFSDCRDNLADVESLVLGMSIESVFDPNDALEFSFRLVDWQSVGSGLTADDEARWKTAA